MEQKKSALVDIKEIVEHYLPVSRKKARKFVSLYLDGKKIGNRLMSIPAPESIQSGR